MSEPRKLTGYHVLAIFGGAFSIIIGVNVVLATQAVRTFPGLEVKNSYVASQTFDADRAAQQALGWTVTASIERGKLRLRFDGANGPVEPRLEKVTLGRPTYTGQDQNPALTFDGTEFTAPVDDIAPGNWDLWIEATAADGTRFRQRLELKVVG